MDIDNTEKDLVNQELEEGDVPESEQKVPAKLIGLDLSVELLQQSKNQHKTATNNKMDNNTIIHMSTSGPISYNIRCTMKILFIAEEDAVMGCIQAIKAFFKQLQMIGDRKLHIVPWYKRDEDSIDIKHINQFLCNKAELSNYYPRFFIRKSVGSRVGYIQINLDHVK